jgi:hypothetical protein
LIAWGRPIWQPASPRSSMQRRRSSPCSSHMSLRPRRS